MIQRGEEIHDPTTGRVWKWLASDSFEDFANEVVRTLARDNVEVEAVKFVTFSRRAAMFYPTRGTLMG